VTAAIAVDQAGNIYIAEAVFNVVRKVDTKGIISTFAAGGNPGALGDGGPATSARLVFAAATHIGLAVDGAGNLYIADYGDSRIRKVDASGTITTVADGEALASAYFSNNRGGSGDGSPVRITGDQ
jgi:hypothetical protein